MFEKSSGVFVERKHLHDRRFRTALFLAEDVPFSVGVHSASLRISVRIFGHCCLEIYCMTSRSQGDWMIEEKQVCLFVCLRNECQRQVWLVTVGWLVDQLDFPFRTLDPKNNFKVDLTVLSCRSDSLGDNHSTLQNTTVSLFLNYRIRLYSSNCLQTTR